MAETQNLEEERMVKMIEKVKAMEEGRTKSESMMGKEDMNNMMNPSKLKALMKMNSTIKIGDLDSLIETPKLRQMIIMNGLESSMKMKDSKNMMK